MLSSTKHVGTIGEMTVACALMREGWDVYSAFSDCTKADLIAVKDKVIHLHQVKTIQTSKTGAIVACASKVTSRKKVYYAADDFDYLSVYVVDRETIAYIPMSLIAGRSLTLRFEAPKNGAHCIWFSDFAHAPVKVTGEPGMIDP